MRPAELHSAELEATVRLPLNQRQRGECPLGAQAIGLCSVLAAGSLESEPDWHFARDDGILACEKGASSSRKTASALARLVFRKLSGFHSRPIALRSLRS